jgi:hypothetical protein
MTTAHRGSRWSLRSEASVLSIASKRSVLSIGFHWVIPIGRFHRIRRVAVLGGVGSQCGVALLGRLDVVRQS